MDDVAVAVGEHLDFDVARRLHVFLDQHAGVAERRFRLALGGGERLLEIRMLVDPAHAAAAAARHRLDEHRIADLVGLALEKRRRLLLAVIARHHRHAGLLHQRLGAILEAHGADRGGRRPDEHDAGLGAGLGEFGVLRQEAVTRMDALRGGDARRIDQRVDGEIALARRRRPDRNRHVADADMERAGIGLGIDRDGAHAEPLRGARDTNRDLTAVGDQDRREHGYAISPGRRRIYVAGGFPPRALLSPSLKGRSEASRPLLDRGGGARNRAIGRRLADRGRRRLLLADRAR